MGKFGCVLSSYVILTTLGPGILSVIGLGLYRFLVIVNQIYLTQLQVYAFIAVIWGSVPTLMVIFTLGLSPDQYSLISLKPSGLYCLVANENPDFINRLLGWVICLFIGGSIVFVVFCYVRIGKYNNTLDVST